MTEPGVTSRIGDESEIQVHGPGQMLGYYKRPDLTAQALTQDGFLRTGDQGEVDADGYLRIIGRIKDIFKTAKGRYVAPVPIETKLSNHPSVDNVCVAGTAQPQPFALVMLAPAAQARAATPGGRTAVTRELEALLQETNAELEASERLACMVVVREPWTIENGLLTPTLKIRRSAIEARYMKYAAAWRPARLAVLW